MIRRLDYAEDLEGVLEKVNEIIDLVNEQTQSVSEPWQYDADEVEHLARLIDSLEHKHYCDMSIEKLDRSRKMAADLLKSGYRKFQNKNYINRRRVKMTLLKCFSDLMNEEVK